MVIVQVNVFVLNGTKANQIASTLKDKQLSVKVHKALEISRSIKTAFDFKIADCSLDRGKNPCSMNENGDYMKMENYAPPFSTVLEESSCSTNCKNRGKIWFAQKKQMQIKLNKFNCFISNYGFASNLKLFSNNLLVSLHILKIASSKYYVIINWLALSIAITLKQTNVYFFK